MIAILVLLAAACTGGVNEQGASTKSVDLQSRSQSATPPATPGTSFNACVGRLDGICKHQVLVLAGDGQNIIAEIRPFSPGMRAILLRRADDGSWQRIASVAVNDRGRMSWEWVTTDQDVRGRRPWAFKYRIPGHGESDVVYVRVIAPPF
jgi:hypothetical protein